MTEPVTAATLDALRSLWRASNRLMLRWERATEAERAHLWQDLSDALDAADPVIGPFEDLPISNHQPTDPAGSARSLRRCGGA